MKLAQADEKALTALGAKASRMLAQHDYAGLAREFGYALSHGREIAAAIEADYLGAVASPYEHVGSESVVVRYFEPNTTGLFAVVECLVPVANRAAVLLELTVTGEAERYVTIEDISGVAV